MAKDLSNFLITVDRKPIFSTVPSTTPSTEIESPILNLFSTNTKTPEIKFLNKSWAPKATATPNKPRPAIIETTLTPHISNTEADPKIIIMILKARKIQCKRSLDKRSSTFLIRNEIGSTIWWINQKIIMVIKERFRFSINNKDLPSKSK